MTIHEHLKPVNETIPQIRVFRITQELSKLDPASLWEFWVSEAHLLNPEQQWCLFDACALAHNKQLDRRLVEIGLSIADKCAIRIQVIANHVRGSEL